MNSSLKFLNFSPSTRSSLSNPPLAESTALESPISRQLQTNIRRRSISPLYNPSKLRSAVKIDPHVLTDAQSSGIVSRLVKYYDHSSNEPERSRIVYNKFGDFPIVQLKKTELKRPIVKSSSVRIAPPSKLVMNPTLRAAIMRSNSFSLGSGVPKILPTKMRSKDDSHQIIRNHEPIMDTNFPTSSKSVLDALEKNCRKRINNEELTLDRNKKFCNPISASELDGSTVKEREFIPISSPPLSSSVKRSRDISPIKSSSSSISEASQPLKRIKTRNNALLSSLSSSHYNLIPCTTKNNSSIVSNENFQRHQKTYIGSTELSSTIRNINKSKPQTEENLIGDGQQLVIRTSQESSSQASQPISITSVTEAHREIAPVELKRKLHLFNVKPDPNRFKLKYLENNIKDDDEDDEIKIRFVKPKPAAIENYEAIEHPRNYKLTKMLSGLSTGFKSPPIRNTDKDVIKDTVDAEEKQKVHEKAQQVTASISFVTNTTTSAIAPISSPTTSSVISMSSTPSLILPETKNAVEKPSINSPSNVPTSQIATTTNSIATNSLPKPTFGGFQFRSTTTTATTSSEVSKNLISFTPVSVSIPSSANVNTTSSFSLSSVTDQSKPLISFTPIASITSSEQTVSSTSTGSVASTSASTLPTFGAVSKTNSSLGGFSFGTSNEQSKLGTIGAGGFNFGNNSSSSSSTNASTNSSVAAIKSISFGSNQPALPNIPSSTSSLTSSLLPPISTQTTTSNFQSVAPAVTTSISGGFSFGSSTLSQNMAFGNSSISGIAPLSKSPTFSKPETTVASGIGFSFGGGGKPTSFGSNISNSGNVNLPTTSTTSGSATSPTFSFGTSTTNASSFAGFGAVQKSDQQSAPIFSFNQQQKPQTSTPSLASLNNSSPTFNFGSSNVATTQASNTNAFSFNKTQSEEPAKAGGIFSRLGDKIQTTNEVKPFSFNANSNQNNSVSPFGNSNAAVSTTASIFNQPTFGQNSIMGSSNSIAGGNSNLFSQNNQTQSVFGGSTQSQLHQQQQSSSIFSFSSPPNDELKRTNAFNFGSSNAPLPTSSSTSIFGGGQENNSSQNVSASFTFNPNTGGISSTTPNVFGQNQISGSSSAPPPPPAYQFGSTSNGNNNNTAIGNNVSVSFKFSGASASAPTPQTNNNAFNFGNPTPSPSLGAFNFQAQQQQQQNATGIFNIGTGGNQNQRRLIRTASRRFK